jgi:hypothetical protein
VQAASNLSPKDRKPLPTTFQVRDIGSETNPTLLRTPLLAIVRIGDDAGPGNLRLGSRGRFLSRAPVQHYFKWSRLPVSAPARSGYSSFHRTQIAVQPVECFLDHFIPGNAVARFVDDSALVLFGRTPHAEHREL